MKHRYCKMCGTGHPIGISTPVLCDKLKIMAEAIAKIGGRRTLGVTGPWILDPDLVKELRSWAETGEDLEDLE